MVNNADLVSARADELSLFDANRYFASAKVQGRRQPVIGNDDARMTALMMFAVAGRSVMVRGEAGSGKSQILNAVVSLMWGDTAFADGVDELMFIGAASDKAYLTPDKVDRIRAKSTHCVIPELQNALNLEDMIKLWCEDKPYIYDRAMFGGAQSQKIALDPLPILTNIADENKKIKELNEEIERRFIQVYTDSTKEQNERIHEMKARHRMLPDHILYPFGEMDASALRLKCQYAHKLLHSKTAGIKVINPFANHIRTLLPAQYTVSCTLVDYLFDLTETITAYHWKKRMNNERRIFAELYDNWAAWQIIGPSITDASLKLTGLGREVMVVLPYLPPGDNDDITRQSRAISDQDVMTKLEHRGIARSMKQVRSALGSLCWSYYAEEFTIPGRGKVYIATRKVVERANADWSRAFESGVEVMRRNYPELLDNFTARQMSSAEWIHPLDGTVHRVLGAVEKTEKSEYDRVMREMEELAYIRAFQACTDEESRDDDAKMIQTEIETHMYNTLRENHIDVDDIRRQVEKGCARAQKDRKRSDEKHGT
jgi:hypothetical protein